MKTYKRLLDKQRWPAASTAPKPQSDSLPAAFQAFAYDPATFAAYQAMSDELKLLCTQAKKSITRSGVGTPDAGYISTAICYNYKKRGIPDCKTLSQYGNLLHHFMELPLLLQRLTKHGTGVPNAAGGQQLTPLLHMS